MASDVVEIDDSLYSRQRYVLGDGAMQKLAKANVLIVGLGGVGIEIAKNVILAGVKSVTLYDKTESTENDLGLQFFLKQQDIEEKLTRATACCKRLAELNPYVNVKVLENFSLENTKSLDEFQCVVVTEMLFKDQIVIDNYCRQRHPPIPYISCDVHGVFSYLFCDFGDQFEVVDSNDEDSREIMIKSISKGATAVVNTLDYKRHGLMDGERVSFREIKGMEQLNGRTCAVVIIDPYSFKIECDTSNFDNYLHGGVFMKTKKPFIEVFTSLESQLLSPDVLLNDLSKPEAPLHSLVGIITLHNYWTKNDIAGKLIDNITELVKQAHIISSSMQNTVNETVIKVLAKTCSGKFSPLCASIGGIASQEVLKAVSGKFTPLKQWLLLDTIELARQSNVDFQIPNNRYFHLKTCINADLIEKLRDLKLFMVGCGAIGCEMMKNMALLGISAGENGVLTITDNDLIEKSNLNRQFLFRPWHLQQAKSVTAAEASKEINPDLHILAHQNKVSTETQEKLYNDAFFGQQHIVVNALDNIEARRYVDGRCVSNKKPLIETGTMGPKGHVQVIVPFMTESYSNQRDPIDEDVPYCTLKSFPQIIEHTIQWARDKFESLFTLKPTNFNKFWNVITPSDLGKNLIADSSVPDGFVDAARLLQKKPCDWETCLNLGRIKFEQYFNHKALQLLHVFPLDTKLPDGSWFWQSPKRPPTPIKFDQRNLTHMQFIKSYAWLTAAVYGVDITKEDVTDENVVDIVLHTDVPSFIPLNKKIEIDENVQKDRNKQDDTDKITLFVSYLKENIQQDIKVPHLKPEHFEKDDDSNHHIDFITASSNLRATMYNIEPADRFKTKRIAGKIIPAIATTTATIAGLASIELLKIIAGHPIEDMKNCFLNLALPMMVLSEPGPAPKTKIVDGLEFTSWDQWDVHGNTDYKLEQFMHYFKSNYKLNVSMVCQGVKMVYVPFMPGHKKRVSHSMIKLLKPSEGQEYVDLIISFQALNVTNNEEDDLPAPPVRYYFYK